MKALGGQRSRVLRYIRVILVRYSLGMRDIAYERSPNRAFSYNCVYPPIWSSALFLQRVLEIRLAANYGIEQLGTLEKENRPGLHLCIIRIGSTMRRLNFMS